MGRRLLRSARRHDRHRRCGRARPSPASGAAKAPTPVTEASTSARGVTSTEINVVFPVVNLQALSSEIGFAGDVEYTEQAKAIKLFVGQINESGGINGRKINPIISYFDPTDESNMRALCKDWTEGSPAAFAVLDGVGDWSGDNELCITQEGHTPFLGQWTTVSNWTQQGSPYLWWTGPDDASILQAVVQWGHSAGLLGGNRKVGIIAGDRASDQLALNQYLLPDLKRIGVQPVVETIAAQTSETAATNSDASLDVEKLRAAGVDSLIPLMPFNAFLPVLGAADPTAVLPQVAAFGLRGLDRDIVGVDPRSVPEGAERAGGGDDRDVGRHRRLAARRRRAGTTPGCAPVGPPGTRPIRRSRRGT